MLSPPRRTWTRHSVSRHKIDQLDSLKCRSWILWVPYQWARFWAAWSFYIFFAIDLVVLYTLTQAALRVSSNAFTLNSATVSLIFFFLVTIIDVIIEFVRRSQAKNIVDGGRVSTILLHRHARRLQIRDSFHSYCIFRLIESNFTLVDKCAFRAMQAFYQKYRLLLVDIPETVWGLALLWFRTDASLAETVIMTIKVTVVGFRFTYLLLCAACYPICLLYTSDAADE